MTNPLYIHNWDCARDTTIGMRLSKFHNSAQSLHSPHIVPLLGHTWMSQTSAQIGETFGFTAFSRARRTHFLCKSQGNGPADFRCRS